MAITIGNHTSALKQARELNNQSDSLQKSSSKLSSGLRITKASDDPAGLAIALDLLSEADISSVATRNLSDGASVTAIADGALESVGDITNRMSELATQASNGTLSSTQRSALDNEYQQLRGELDRISQTTEFNGVKLLSENTNISLQAGTDSSSNSQIVLSLPAVSSSSLKLPTSIAQQEDALAAVDSISDARNTVSQSRGEIGAVTSRFQTALDNLATSELGQRDAASRIRDVDVASESSSASAQNIKQQVSAAMSAQANINSSIALQLLG